MLQYNASKSVASTGKRTMCEEKHHARCSNEKHPPWHELCRHKAGRFNQYTSNDSARRKMPKRGTDLHRHGTHAPQQKPAHSQTYSRGHGQGRSPGGLRRDTSAAPRRAWRIGTPPAMRLARHTSPPTPPEAHGEMPLTEASGPHSCTMQERHGSQSTYVKLAKTSENRTQFGG